MFSLCKMHRKKYNNKNIILLDNFSFQQHKPISILQMGVTKNSIMEHVSVV